MYLDTVIHCETGKRMILEYGWNKSQTMYWAQARDGETKQIISACTRHTLSEVWRWIKQQETDFGNITK